MNEENLRPMDVLERVQLNIKKGVRDRRHGYHYMTFSNFDLNNEVSSRTIVLRNYNKKENLITFHSDIRSPKINEIKYNNKCQLLFYSDKLKEQLRINVLSSVEYNNSITKQAWEETRFMSRKCYLTLLPPGTEIDEASDGIPKNLKGKEPQKNESELGYINFAVIVNSIKSIDWLFLSSQGHKRLFFNFIKGKWNCKWKIP